MRIQNIKKLSIIIPVYNEERTIVELLKKVLLVKLPLNMKKEMIIIDDYSNDKSFDLILNFKHNYDQRTEIKTLKHNKNMGKGSSVTDGINLSTGDVLVIQDADLEYDPVDFKKLIEPILKEKTDVVYGTRLKHYPLRLTGKHKTPLITHYIGNKLLTLATEILYQKKVSDMETCYKMFRRSVIQKITVNAKRFDFEPEFTAKILKKGYRIYEIPIKVHPRGYAEGKKLFWKDGFVALWTLIKYRFVD